MAKGKAAPLELDGELTIRNQLSSVELHPSNEQVLLGDHDVTLVDLAGKPVVTYYKAKGGGWVIARITPDGKRVVGSSVNLSFWVWDGKTAKCTFETKSEHFIVTSLAVSRDGTRVLASAHHDHLTLWDIVKGAPLGELGVKKKLMAGAALSPDGKLAAYGGTDGYVRIYDFAAKREVSAAPGKGSIEVLETSADGSVLVSGGREKAALVWTWEGERVRSLAMGRSIAAMSVSPDGRQVAAVGGRGPASIFDVGTGKEIGTIDGHSVGMSCLRYSFDGTRIVTGGYDKRVCIWRAP